MSFLVLICYFFHDPGRTWDRLFCLQSVTWYSFEYLAAYRYG